jgi:histidyl-tRNA synthetase
VERISDHLYALGYGDDRVSLDLSIARGLAYYTGPVFEAILLDDKGEPSKFGSVFGGGRYDDLVLRFLGERVPATGASIGVDRLLAALIEMGRIHTPKSTAKVLVTRMDPALEGECLGMVQELRRVGIPAELYLGTAKGPGKQLKYADQMGVPLALLYGSSEKERGVVTLKDMEVGRRKAETLAKREEWLEERPGQREVPRTDLVAAVREMLVQIEGASR